MSKASKNAPASNKLISDFTENLHDEQPAWARNLEQRILDRFDRESKRVVDLESRTSDLEWHSRKYNILIFGINVTGDNCEDKVQQLFRDELGIPTDPLLAACHPIPTNEDGVRVFNKAAIVRFMRLKDKDLAMKSLKNLKGKNLKVSVKHDLPIIQMLQVSMGTFSLVILFF